MHAISLSLIATAALAAALAGTAPRAAAQATPMPGCDGVQQDKAACKRETGAAKQEAGRGGLTSPAPSSQEANALARCQNVAAPHKGEREARVKGNSSSSSGSVMGGGVVRETVTPVPAPSPAK